MRLATVLVAFPLLPGPSQDPGSSPLDEAGIERILSLAGFFSPSAHYRLQKDTVEIPFADAQLSPSIAALFDGQKLTYEEVELIFNQAADRRGSRSLQFEVWQDSEVVLESVLSGGNTPRRLRVCGYDLCHFPPLNQVNLSDTTPRTVTIQSLLGLVDPLPFEQSKLLDLRAVEWTEVSRAEGSRDLVVSRAGTSYPRYEIRFLGSTTEPLLPVSCFLISNGSDGIGTGLGVCISYDVDEQGRLVVSSTIQVAVKDDAYRLTLNTILGLSQNDEEVQIELPLSVTVFDERQGHESTGSWAVVTRDWPLEVLARTRIVELDEAIDEE